LRNDWRLQPAANVVAAKTAVGGIEPNFNNLSRDRYPKQLSSIEV
jgi:hypothetical protein